MGLAERRAIKKVQDELIPATQARIKEISGAEVAIELDVPTFEAHPKCMGAAGGDEFPSVLKVFAFDSLEAALVEMCKDTMSKEAIKNGFKKVELKQVPDGASRKLAFASGVLSIAEQFNLGRYYSRSEITRVLENGL